MGGRLTAYQCGVKEKAFATSSLVDAPPPRRLRRDDQRRALSFVSRQKKFDPLAVAGEWFLAIELVDCGVESLLCV